MVIKVSKIIGMTGGIATGKSTASKYLIEKGYQVIDCDKMVHQLYNENYELNASVIKFFGDEIAQEKKVNLKKLSKKVFNNQKLLNKLMQIIFPYIEAELKKNLLSINTDIVIIDAPTFFEMGLNRFVDQTLMISCDSITQLNRLMTRNKLGIVEAEKIINSQWQVDVKERLSDCVIDNSSSVDRLKSSLDFWLGELKTS